MEFRHASVMDRVEFGLIKRIWCGRWRGGEVMGVEKGDRAELVGRVLGTLALLPPVGIEGIMLAERETGRED